MSEPQLPNDALYASPRFAVVTSIAADIDVVATYGSLTREIMVLGTAGGNLVVTQSSPWDRASPDVTIPVPAQSLPLPISVSKIKATTAAGVLPLLLLF